MSITLRTFCSDGDSGTPSISVQAANPWYDIRDTCIVHFVVDGCRKNLPLCGQSKMWPRLKFRRLPILFWLSVSCVVVLHAVLCNGATTCRGYPPLNPNELIGCFIAPFFAFIPALFAGDRETRNRGIIAMSILLGITYGAVSHNLGSIRPHPGAHLGFIGLLASDWLPILFSAVFPSLACFGFLYFYERVTGDMWSLVRTTIPGNSNGDRIAA